jgi:hypothetical protein
MRVQRQLGNAADPCAADTYVVGNRSGHSLQPVATNIVCCFRSLPMNNLAMSRM